MFEETLIEVKCKTHQEGVVSKEKRDVETSYSQNPLVRSFIPGSHFCPHLGLSEKAGHQWWLHILLLESSCLLASLPSKICPKSQNMKIVPGVRDSFTVVASAPSLATLFRAWALDAHPSGAPACRMDEAVGQKVQRRKGRQLEVGALSAPDF